MHRQRLVPVCDGYVARHCEKASRRAPTGCSHRLGAAWHVNKEALVARGFGSAVVCATACRIRTALLAVLVWCMDVAAIRAAADCCGVLADLVGGLSVPLRPPPLAVSLPERTCRIDKNKIATRSASCCARTWLSRRRHERPPSKRSRAHSAPASLTSNAGGCARTSGISAPKVCWSQDGNYATFSSTRGCGVDVFLRLSMSAWLASARLHMPGRVRDCVLGRSEAHDEFRQTAGWRPISERPGRRCGGGVCSAKDPRGADQWLAAMLPNGGRHICRLVTIRIARLQPPREQSRP